MDRLIDKSQKYKRAANNLHDNGLFCPEVHCRYYSCLQWMLHVTSTYHPDIDFSRELSSHVKLIRLIADDIQEKTQNKSQATKFERKINKLKRFRVKADYQKDIITEQEANETRDLESFVKNILTKVYGIT